MSTTLHLPQTLSDNFKETVLLPAWTTLHATMRAMGSLIPHLPSVKQQRFLLHAFTSEVLFGGAAGGGKSDALLMAALQFVHIPNYAALLLRRSYADLAIPGALIPRSHEWLTGQANWNEQRKQWVFPSGAVLQFGYLETENDKYRYQSSEFCFVGFDELTQFTESQYLYLFSRLRRPAVGPLSKVPLRMRSASNPGGVGHQWVKDRFVVRQQPGRVFVPAKLDDNPGIDREQYELSLSHLDPITRAQLLAGDWDAYAGGRFRREWFRRYRLSLHRDAYNMDGCDRPLIRKDCSHFVALDPAARAKESNDYTAIVVLTHAPGEMGLMVSDVVRERLALDKIVPRLAQVCDEWKPIAVGIEASGFQVAIANEAKKHPACGYAVMDLEPRGKEKLVRATPAMILAEQGRLFLPDWAPWLADFEAELVQFTGDDKIDAHDDQVDALAYAVQIAQQFLGDGAAELPAAGRRRAW